MKSIGLAVIFATLGIGSAIAQSVSIVTTPSGSFTNSAGAAMAKVIGEKSKVRAILQAQALQGMIPVAAGTAEFGMGNGFDTTFYVTGTGEYEGQGAAPQPAQCRLAAALPGRAARARGFRHQVDCRAQGQAGLLGLQRAKDHRAHHCGASCDRRAHLQGRDRGAHSERQPLGRGFHGRQDRRAVLRARLGGGEAGGGDGRRLTGAADRRYSRGARAHAGVAARQLHHGGRAPPGIEGISRPTKVVAFDMVL